uniref:S1 motif domain-containing protein n=1 Tax=Alexandrium monilatum TaxID=311494 RepID=A0A7S4PTM7_9DINO
MRGGLAFVGAPAGHGLPLVEAPLPRGSERLRGNAGHAASGGLGTSGATCVGLAAAACVAAAAARRARSAVRRRAVDGPGGFYQKSIIPSGTTTSTMTEEEQEDFLEKRCDALEKLMPMSDQEFDDEVEELTWTWARHLLPYTNVARADKAAHKRKTILRQKAFFKKMRLFKPLAIKYPTLMKRLIVQDNPDMEDIRYKISGEWIANEEKIAGFTYEDFVKGIDGGKYTGWKLPQVGDEKEGTVVDFDDKGAFLDIGDKAWAFVPLDQVSLVPISKAEEVLKLGQTVKGKVICEGGHSRLIGDEFVTQFIVSITALESEAAWEAIDKITRGESDASPILQVSVMSMKSFGAVVMTETGLEALIPNSQLADRVGDTSLVGQTIGAQIFQQNVEKRNAGPALAPRDFALLLSYKNVATKELAAKLEEGMVVDATVKMPLEKSLDVMVDNVQCTIRKVDISGKTAFNLMQLFEVDEKIKVYVLSTTEESGEIRLSTRALERRPGEILRDKAGMFERAEATAKMYLKSSRDARKALLSDLEDVLADLPGLAGGAPPKKPGGAIYLDDDDDDGGIGF